MNLRSWALGRDAADLDFVRNLSWWPSLVAPLVVAAVWACSPLFPGFRTLQSSLEVPAPWLVGAVAAVLAARTYITRRPNHLWLMALALAFMLRENRDVTGLQWMSKGIYVMLAGLGLWAWMWRRHLLAEMKGDPRHTAWFVAAVLAYVLSQVIARRAFRFIPGEQGIHRAIEEVAETVAHLVFLTAALVGTWRRSAASEQASNQPIQATA